MNPTTYAFRCSCCSTEGSLEPAELWIAERADEPQAPDGTQPTVRCTECHSVMLLDAVIDSQQGLTTAECGVVSKLLVATATGAVLNITPAEVDLVVEVLLRHASPEERQAVMQVRNFQTESGQAA